MSITRTKIQNSIIASKINIDYININSTKKQIEKQLSQKELLLYKKIEYPELTVYHMDSFYRDNANDKYDLINNITLKKNQNRIEIFN
jgi:hypothetical protein